MRHQNHLTRPNRQCQPELARDRQGRFGLRLLITLAATLTALALLTGSASQSAQADSPAPDTYHHTHDVIVIAFQQTWNEVASECKQTYGPEGVGYVEVSPPQESIRGSQWWTSYQPVSYGLDSKQGTEAEFRQMVETCKAAKVDIIADVVLNQAAGGSGQTAKGVDGTTYDAGKQDYPGFPFGPADFHRCTDSISDYTNQNQVQSCRLDGMNDLDSGSAHVQDVQSSYLARLYRDGVVGFRIDAAKHIKATDLKAIKAQMAKKVGRPADEIWWIQEVIDAGGEAPGINSSNYYGTGDVTEFSYAYLLRSDILGSPALLRSDIAALKTPSGKADVFVTNWDTERGTQTLNPTMGAPYSLANAFMLAYPYGQPRLISDYYFANGVTDPGPKGATATRIPDVIMDIACAAPTHVAGQWMCEQRWTPTRGMIKFRNAVNAAGEKLASAGAVPQLDDPSDAFAATEPVTDWHDYGDSTIGFGRGSVAYLALNASDRARTASFTTSLPNGTYCNVYTVQDCSQTVTVKAGKFTAKVGAQSAVAIYVGGEKNHWPHTEATFDPSDPKFVAGAQTRPESSNSVAYQLTSRQKAQELLQSTYTHSRASSIVTLLIAVLLMVGVPTVLVTLGRRFSRTPDGPAVKKTRPKK